MTCHKLRFSLIEIYCLYIILIQTRHQHSSHATSTLPPASAATPSRSPSTPQCKWANITTSINDNNNSHNHKYIIANDDNDDNGKNYNSFTCELREFNQVNEIVVAANSFAQFNIKCDVVQQQPLDDGAPQFEVRASELLKRLPQVRDFRIEHCRFKRLPEYAFRAMRNLRYLTVSTHNNPRGTFSHNLDIKSSSFDDLIGLAYLDLSNNNVWNVAPSTFCSLSALEVLNLSRNALADVAQLEFGGSNASTRPCKYGSLKVLDLSHNRIAQVGGHEMALLRNLQKLFLQNNQLKNLNDFALDRLGQLQSIDLSNNALVALPVSLWHSSGNLLEIYLQNNSLSALADRIFENLANLQILELSHNRLRSNWVKAPIFAGLAQLTYLNLAHNLLTEVEQNLFADLRALDTLNLEHNLIMSIESQAFQGLVNLKILNLSHNSIKALASNYFRDTALSQLLLESNQIRSIDLSAFDHLTTLTDLNLNKNQLQEIPLGLYKLVGLKSLDLGKNDIHRIKGERFKGLDQLLGLRLVDNFITHIFQDTFEMLPSLHVLNLASNQIKYLDKSAFTANQLLRAIRLDNNQIEDIADIFSTMSALAWLNISDNNIKWFDYSFMPATLEWLDVHANHIQELGHYYPAREEGSRVHYLDASFNSITHVSEASLPAAIAFLYLNNNSIVEVAPGTLLDKRQLEKIDLSNNHIQRLDLAAFKLSAQPIDMEMPELDLQHNPIHCDCNAEWLQTVERMTKSYHQYPVFKHLDAVRCHTMEHRNRQFHKQQKRLVQLQPVDFLCKYDGHCFALCHCCEYDACDCKMTCPVNCNCYHDNTWNVNVVDCGGANYYDVPKRIPMDATTIYLDGNDIGYLGNHLFIGKKKLDVLYLNNSQIEEVHNKTFVGVPSLRVLHLEQNRLKVIRGNEFEQLNSLEELHLDRNQLQSIGAETFVALKALHTVCLQGNHIQSFEFTQGLPAVVFRAEHFADNNWECDCFLVLQLEEKLGDTDPMAQFLEGSCPKLAVSKLIGDCHATYPSGMVSNRIKPTAIKPNSIDHPLISREYLQIFAAILVSIIGTALVITLVCIFRSNFSLWLYGKYRIRLHKDPTRGAGGFQHKIYDAYIVYSCRDIEFIQRIIYRELEKYSYNLCLHYRQPGNVGIGGEMNPRFAFDSIVELTSLSKRVVIVLTGNFLQNEWTNSDFRICVQNIVYSTKYSHRRHRIVLIVAAPLDLIMVDPILEIFVKSSTIIFWGEKQFWVKLKYALPDVEQQFGGTKTNNLCRNPVPKASNHNLVLNVNSKSIINNVSSLDDESSDENSSNMGGDGSMAGSPAAICGGKKMSQSQTYIDKSNGHIYTSIAEHNNPHHHQQQQQQHHNHHEQMMATAPDDGEKHCKDRAYFV